MATIKLNLVSVNHKPLSPKTSVIQTCPRGSENEKTENRIDTRIMQHIPEVAVQHNHVN